MMVVQQVLPDHGEFKSAGGMPAQPQIQLEVTRHRPGVWSVIIMQGIHPAQPGIHFYISREIHRRTKRELLLGIGRFVEGPAKVHLARLDAEVLFNQIIAAMQPPPGEHLISGAEFNAVGLTFQIVVEDKREAKGGKAGRAGSGAPHMIVVIIKNRKRGGWFWAPLGPMAPFLFNTLFWSRNKTAAPDDLLQ